MEKLDLKDRKILYELDLNCRQSNTQIGKKVGLSRKVVEYRIKRMEEDGIITGYWTAINTFKLGYYAFRIYINFFEVNPIVKKEIIQYFADCKNAWAVLEIKGPIDLDIILWVDDIYEFNQFWEKTLEMYGIHFSSSTVSILTQAITYKKSYLLSEDKKIDDRIFYITDCRGKPVKIDKIDYLILNEIVLDAKIPLIDLSKKLNMSSQSINYRIKNMINSDLIQAFHINLNLSKLGFQNALIDFYLKDYKKKKLIMSYLEKNTHLEDIMEKTIGWSDLNCSVIVDNLNKLTEITEDINSQFPGSIRKTNYWLEKRIHKERWLPKMDFK